ncbi:hypothetical protein NDU88_006665 [Pleurodeles waltl]|uniref:Uncharacterized protein n=1 Tax=Pleurodeles waltl TaxID=8319 RepID=A0AAV7UQC3_PLEWA|nr:hypothetical protein NDU88_006665 [Pleurodeles waltl]
MQTETRVVGSGPGSHQMAGSMRMRGDFYPCEWCGLDPAAWLSILTGTPLRSTWRQEPTALYGKAQRHSPCLQPQDSGGLRQQEQRRGPGGCRNAPGSSLLREGKGHGGGAVLRSSTAPA